MTFMLSTAATLHFYPTRFCGRRHVDNKPPKQESPKYLGKRPGRIADLTCGCELIRPIMTFI